VKQEANAVCTKLLASNVPDLEAKFTENSGAADMHSASADVSSQTVSPALVLNTQMCSKKVTLSKSTKSFPLLKQQTHRVNTP